MTRPVATIGSAMVRRRRGGAVGRRRHRAGAWPGLTGQPSGRRPRVRRAPVARLASAPARRPDRGPRAAGSRPARRRGGGRLQPARLAGDHQHHRVAGVGDGPVGRAQRVGERPAERGGRHQRRARPPGLTSTSRAAQSPDRAGQFGDGGGVVGRLVGRVEQDGHPAAEVVDEQRLVGRARRAAAPAGTGRPRTPRRRPVVPKPGPAAGRRRTPTFRNRSRRGPAAASTRQSTCSYLSQARVRPDARGGFGAAVAGLRRIIAGERIGRARLGCARCAASRLRR